MSRSSSKTAFKSYFNNFVHLFKTSIMTLIIDPLEQEQEQPQKKSKPDSAKPLVGFLFSYSKTAEGEYWPLFEGKNTVGSHKSCQQALYEQSVSNPHANIFAIRKKGEERLEFRIQDAGSEISTIVDGEQLMVGDVASLKDRSVIQIGKYNLFCVLIDYVADQMAPNPDFSPVGKADKDFSTLKEIAAQKESGKNPNFTTT